MSQSESGLAPKRSPVRSCLLQGKASPLFACLAPASCAWKLDATPHDFLTSSLDSYSLHFLSLPSLPLFTFLSLQPPTQSANKHHFLLIPTTAPNFDSLFLLLSTSFFSSFYFLLLLLLPFSSLPTQTSFPVARANFFRP